jgi:hypothetical protein
MVKRLALDRISPKMSWIDANIVFLITQSIRAVGLRDMIYHSSGIRISDAKDIPDKARLHSD